MDSLKKSIDNITFENLINLFIRMRNESLLDRNYYYHIACLFKDNKKNVSIFSIGTNTHNAINSSKHPTTHAECKSLYNLNPKIYNKDNKFDMMILRISVNRNLGNSKPCINCLCSMYNFSKKRGFKLDKIHYSLDADVIKTESFSNLISQSIEGNYHTSEYYSKFKFNPKKLNI